MGTIELRVSRKLSPDHRFVGGEAQFYIDNLTLYGQGGYVEFVPDDVFTSGLDDGFFARGVVRYFPTSDSRLQLEGTYSNGMTSTFPGTIMEVFHFGEAL